jgi:8-oxo-dGTP pyrophosphatase MutT (NUDIX family)
MSRTKAELSKLLLQGPRIDLSESFSRASGVALVLCTDAPAMTAPSAGDLTHNPYLELLFIKRAINPLDNWSGQIAFPGGKRDPDDPTLLATCLREVHEEVALKLSTEDLVGSLNDLQARKKGHPLEFYVQPFVFFVERRPAIYARASEVADVLWVPLLHLQDKSNHTHYVFERDGMNLSLPAIRLPSGDILWGLSHMMVTNFLDVLASAKEPSASSTP